MSLTAPANGATVLGSAVTLSASASDDVGVAGVQFKANGVSVGSEDTSSPYSITWDSTATSSGSKSIVAVARDAAGNYATSTVVSITVDNTAPSPSSISSGTPTDTTATITWTTDEAATSKVVYGLTSSYGTASTSAPLVTSHSIGITGLTANTTYHYAVVSADTLGNTATSSDQSFTTDYDPAAATLFAAMTTTPTTSRKGQINTLIASLKSAKIWSLLDVLYVLAANDSQAALLNWKSPGNFTLISSGTVAPAFTPNRGYQSDGANARLRTQFTPSSNGVNYTLNDASAWAWGLVEIAESRDIIGSAVAPRMLLQPRSSGNTIQASINDAGLTGTSNSTSKGLFGISRSTSAVVKTWRNGAQVGSNVSITSTALANQEQWILGGDATSFSLNEVAFAAWGASLAGLESSFYTAVNAYISAVLDTSTWDGTPFLAFGQRGSVSAGSVLTYEYTQPWTAMAAVKLFQKPTAASIIFSNVTTAPAFPGYELWINSSGHLHVRLINNVVTPKYVGVSGSQDLSDVNRRPSVTPSTIGRSIA